MSRRPRPKSAVLSSWHPSRRSYMDDLIDEEGDSGDENGKHK